MGFKMSKDDKKKLIAVIALLLLIVLVFSGYFFFADTIKSKVANTLVAVGRLDSKATGKEEKASVELTTVEKIEAAAKDARADVIIVKTGETGEYDIDLNVKASTSNAHLIERTNYDTTDLLKKLVDISEIKELRLTYYATMYNKYGEGTELPVISYVFKASEYKKIVFESFFPDNLPDIAEEYKVNDILK